MLWVEFEAVSSNGYDQRWPRRFAIRPGQYAWLLTRAISKYYVTDLLVRGPNSVLTVDVRTDLKVYQEYKEFFGSEGVGKTSDNFIITQDSCAKAIVHTSRGIREYDFKSDLSAYIRFCNDMSIITTLENT